MVEFLDKIAEQFAALAFLEFLAVAFAVLYLVLAIRQNILCWICAGISTAIFVYVYFGANLYMESALNIFYFGMAVYGFHEWRSGGVGRDQLPVTTWSLETHGRAILVIALLTLSFGFLLSTRTDAAFPYIDSGTTFAAIWATYLVARKVLENWWYWLVIDVVSIPVNWARDLELAAALFALYVVLIPVGIVSWTRSYRGEQQAAAAAA